MTIQFFGASGTVTGSCYLLSTEKSTILIDAGMFQGTDEITALNLKPPDINYAQIDAVILTHAHLDHCGRLPQFVARGLSAPIYCTRPTREIAEIALMDSAKIGENDPDTPQLYSTQDVINTLDMLKPGDYHQAIDILDWKIELFDAGHILGSASIQLHHKPTHKQLIFSGDLGNSPQDLIKPTEFLDQAHTVIMESTYGDKNHPPEDANQLIAQEVNHIQQSGGTLLIPAFSIQRTQELLHRFNHLKSDKMIDASLPVYLDSPMALKVTKTYARHSEFFNAELEADLKQGDPFDFPGLEIMIKHKQSLRMSKQPGPKVVIAGSGMMTGGRILMHAKTWLQDPASRLLFVGYQGDETLGREIQEGTNPVSINGESVRVRANINSIHALSSHAGQDQLIDWFNHIQGVKQLILTHGEDLPRQTLQSKLQTKHPNVQIHTPKLAEKIIF